MKRIAVVGMQWGDEGKGKVIDLLSEKARHIARAQGGNNAGHTIVEGNREYRFHLIPSGILYPHTKCYIGGGTVVDPESLLKEMDTLRKDQIHFEKRLFLSQYAHVVFPYHRLLDQLIEQKKGKASIGTTGRGIGPCYVDKVHRTGIRVAELIDPALLRSRLDVLVALKNEEFQKVYGHPGFHADEIFTEYEELGKKLLPFVAPVEEMLFEAAENGDAMLFEGAQGALLDVTFGTYPYVTSSCTLSGGVGAGLGFGPSRIDHVIGATKAYTTRVGNGPFPTELSPEELALFPDHSVSREVGTTTGRKRRMGWLDIPILKLTKCLNGTDSLAIMKLDILDGLDEIKICTGYKLHGKLIKSFPAAIEHLAEAKPVYETHPGWKKSTREVRVYDDLPSKAKAYLRRIEELLNSSVSIISVGPERERTIWMDRPFRGSMTTSLQEPDAELQSREIPRHIAIIMDGNRRWAKRRGLPPSAGHWEGAETLTEIVRAAADAGIKTLTVYSFSTENWSRSEEEIEGLMNLFELYLTKKRDSLVQDGVRLDAIGDLDALPDRVKEALDLTRKATSACDRINLVLAINYGGRDEIRRALCKIVEKGLKAADITEELISSELDTHLYGDPDLLIRTSGELRISNFLIWQISYAEIYTTDVLWPDFRPPGSTKQCMNTSAASEEKEVKQ